jgi:calcineurin-like phosphoesterase family protein
MVYFTADSHWGHFNICKYCDRPFKTIEEMDSALILAWNNVVGENDVVYHLGDFCMGDRYTEYSNQLSGQIRIIPGSHDKQLVRKWNQTIKKDEKFQVLPPLVSLAISKEIYVVMCHFSLRTWDRSHYGSFHFYGHSHGRLEEQLGSMDVGVDSAAKILGEYRPFSLEEAIGYIRERDNTR